MLRLITLSSVVAVSVLAYACGSSSSPGKVDGKPGDGKPVDGPPGETAQLTVNNYESWCTVSINHDNATIMDTYTATVGLGAVTLVASPASETFELGSNMWHLVDSDGGSGIAGTQMGTGDTATSTATVTISSTAAKCVWVCCPFSPSGTGCPTTNQCP
ncbi:MAG TPA: hypothetical protein VMJ10_04965 [Kofleriaceae bacterium]|nr:hypothetical protein [Kofleriaceae bacterium]